jgi:cardiolipin synthase
MHDAVNGLLTWIVALTQVLVAAYASGHAILHKRDVRSAIGWVGLIWLVPYIGAMLYGLFGINRIRRRATELRTGRRPPQLADPPPVSSPLVRQNLPAHQHHLGAIGTLLDRIAPFPLTAGNRVRMFDNGSDAYAAMHAAIASARHSVGLATYIFDNDRCGRHFVQALASARERGVDVRVLIDGAGAYYTYPAILGPLKRAGVPAVEFLPTLFPLHLAYANLRSHRKILVVDGCTGFTGGMNIRDAHADETNPRTAIQDVHFQIEGPAVAHLETTFLDDWHFAAGDGAENPGWAAAPTPIAAPITSATTLARGIAGGPDENFESIRWAILAALSQAQQRIRIVTPYFVPDQMLISSLILAAMRGVAIDIVVPEKNNLALVQWASQAKAALLLARGCRIWRTPLPFDHSKLMTVDDAWTLIGSANWDQRSLRLNFEFDVECYDPALVGRIDRLIDRKLRTARPWSLAEADGRSLAIKLRDGTAWLLSPYL